MTDADEPLIKVEVSVDRSERGYGYQVVLTMTGSDGRVDVQRSRHFTFKDMADEHAKKVRKSIKKAQDARRGSRSKSP